jgi:hypothetical protein
MRTLLLTSVLTFTGLVGIACGGTAESTERPQSSSAVTPGSSCSPVGAAEPADDGCNTCTCTEGGWSCTEEACGTECTAGDLAGSGSSDGCNTCTCVDGFWSCTEMDCPVEPMCTPGESVVAPDGCNTCLCGDDGTLTACTDKACVEEPVGCGGWLGDTCGDDEYCAYVEGQLCGAADASATCEKRPELCQGDYTPVCGCDGETYSNACVAAGAGTGVNHTGACDAG